MPVSKARSNARSKARSQASLESDFSLLQATVREAGTLAMQYYGRAQKSWHKSDNQPVTEADIAVNELIHKRLLGARPDYGWLSEETEDNLERLNFKRTWIIDPIDGTSAFLQTRPEFSISAALVENNRPLLGCVFNPASDEFYAARKGHGAAKNGQPIHFQGADKISQDIHVCVYPPILQHEAWQHKEWKNIWSKLRVSNRTSVAYRLGLLAESYFDVVIMLNTKKDWDLVAGDLIVHEAGGYVADLDGNPFSYNTANVNHSRTLAGSAPMIKKLGTQIKTLLQSL